MKLTGDIIYQFIGIIEITVWYGKLILLAECHQELRAVKYCKQ